MISIIKKRTIGIIYWLIFKTPLCFRDFYLGVRQFLPDRSKNHKVISLYDNNNKIKVEIREKVIINKGNIVIGDSIVRCWIQGVYSIINLKKTNSISYNDHLSVTYKGLYYDSTLLIELLPSEIEDFYYIDFKEFLFEEEHYYAFRTGKRLFVSKNQTDWKDIYNGKRGIKNSMLFVERDGGVYLIFIEYTPGEIRERHNIWEYSFYDDETVVLKEFCTYDEYLQDHNLSCCRHIHVIDKDPFTNDIYVGTGDNDFESAIWVSNDGGKTYKMLYRNGQFSRTLCFMFTKNSVFWTMDSHEPQFIIRYDRKSKEISLTPIVNGALWHSFNVNIEGEIMYVISSNSEGAHFDNNNRIYGITIENESPCVYELIKSKSLSQYNQLFPIYIKNRDIFLYDILGSCIRKGTIEKKMKEHINF